MALQQDELVDWIEEKWNAGTVIPEVLEHAPDLTVPDAYRVQAARMARHVAEGDRIIGYKAALTSKAMQRQVGIEEPILGTRSLHVPITRKLLSPWRPSWRPPWSRRWLCC